MANIIERPFFFTTPVIVNNILCGTLEIKGVGATYEDDKDLIWTSYALDHVKWDEDNIKYAMIWASQNDLDHIVKQHLLWLFADLKQQAA